MPGRTSTLTWIGVPCAVLLLAACSSDGSSAGGSKETESASGQETTVDTEPAQGTALGCGQPFQPPTAGPLTLTAQFPATVGRESEPVTGSVDVTSATALRGVGLGRAEVFLVRDGRIVTLPLPQDSIGVVWNLAPGTARSIPADASLSSCDPSGAALESGTYDMFVRVVVTSDDGDLVESFGGPWPLQVQ
jgi:hypothetical protein